jgi:glycerate kinase
VITGEGLLDDQSFNGKSVGGVVSLCREIGVPVVVIAGDVEGDQPVEVRTLVDYADAERAWSDTLGCLTELGREVISATRPR